jgi:hypothetical protein
MEDYDSSQSTSLLQGREQSGFAFRACTFESSDLVTDGDSTAATGSQLVGISNGSQVYSDAEMHVALLDEGHDGSAVALEQSGDFSRPFLDSKSDTFRDIVQVCALF